MTKFKCAISMAIILASVSPISAGAKKKEAPSGLELQQIQSRDMDAPKSVSFPAVMSVLQDSGYRIGSADLDTGLITASASTKTKMTFVPFIGFGTKKKTPVVSAFIEDRGPGMSRVRLNFVMGKVSNNASFGGVTDEEPIYDPIVYQDAFEKVSQAIFMRQAIDAPVAAKTVASSAPADVSTQNANATTTVGQVPGAPGDPQ